MAVCLEGGVATNLYLSLVWNQCPFSNPIIASTCLHIAWLCLRCEAGSSITYCAFMQATITIITKQLQLLQFVLWNINNLLTTLSLYVKGRASISRGVGGSTTTGGAGGSIIRERDVRVLSGRGATDGTSAGRGDCTGRRSSSLVALAWGA